MKTNKEEKNEIIVLSDLENMERFVSGPSDNFDEEYDDFEYEYIDKKNKKIMN